MVRRSFRGSGCTEMASGQRYSLEVKQRAREFFVEQGATYEEVAGETGVSLAALKQWGAEGNWTDERKQFEQDYLKVQGKLQKLKIKLIDDAITSLEPQKIYALASVMKAGSMLRGGAQEDRAAQALDWLQRLITFLQKRDQEALRYLEPHLRAFADSLKEAA